jgi:hypothetical protein
MLYWVVPLLVLLIASMSTYRVHRRAQHERAFCAASCHAAPTKEGSVIGKGGDWHLSKHAEVECQECHEISPRTGLKLWWAGTATKNVIPHGKATAKACESCHAKSPAEWTRIATTQGHREHRTAKDVTCLSCHTKTSHGDEPLEATCVTCHKAERLHKPTTAADAETCLSCHSYVATAKATRPPTTAQCERCHADDKVLAASAGPVGLAKAWKPVDKQVLHGGVACQLCHNAHGKKAKAPSGQPICAKCHQFENFQAGTDDKTSSPEGHRNCEGCHQPHSPKKSATQSCVKCHEKNAKGLVAVVKGGKPVPVAAGGTTSALKHDGCPSCHVPHTWRAQRSGCMQCHEDKATLILTRSPEAHNACTNCHEVHGPPPTGAVCVKCHAKTKGNHVALAPAKHKNCTSCHNPHAPLPKDTRDSCAKCHGPQLTQMTRDGPEGHRTCFDCHKPHENPLPPADICAKCHAEKAKLVATAPPPKHRVCLSCHEKHKFKIKDPIVACSKCHGPMFQASATDQGKIPHQGSCKGCHTLHGPPGVAKAACLKCHQNVAAEFNPPNEKHANCRSCHQPHKPVSTARDACGTCHEAKLAVQTKWPANSAHAKTCTGCHQQHDVRNKKVCGNCHAPEATSAMGGKHKCTQCHAPHKAPPGAGPAWWSRCNECHAAKVESVKQRGPTHATCKNCHQPHRFAVPTCVSCHKDMGDKGLHAIPQHAANCAKCHDPHTKASPSPPQCLSCHTNRRNHEPNAKQCQACHMFLQQ